MLTRDTHATPEKRTLRLRAAKPRPRLIALGLATGLLAATLLAGPAAAVPCPNVTCDADPTGYGDGLFGLTDLSADCRSSWTLPVTETVVGPGGSSYQFYQAIELQSNAAPAEPNAPERGPMVFVAYQLQADTITNGVNDWFFGTTITYGETQYAHSDSVLRMNACVPLGRLPQGAAFTYFVDAGAAGWDGSVGCSVTFEFEVNSGWLLFWGDEQITLGGSITCGGTFAYDSESLFRDTGTASLCAPCIVD